MKSVSKFLSLLAFAMVFALSLGTARAEECTDYPVQKNIETRQVHSYHTLNRVVQAASIDEVIYFANASTGLTPQDEHKIKEVAAVLKSPAYHGTHIAVQGFTDSTGKDAANQRLSYHRAVQVMHALVKAGVPASMLSAQGFGKENPVGDNSTAEGRALNRRVVFTRVAQ
jgi:outer membrane protein OmpA-like peptidoglycan-associated protein